MGWENETTKQRRLWPPPTLFSLSGTTIARIDVCVCIVWGWCGRGFGFFFLSLFDCTFQCVYVCLFIARSSLSGVWNIGKGGIPERRRKGTVETTPNPCSFLCAFAHRLFLFHASSKTTIQSVCIFYGVPLFYIYYYYCLPSGEHPVRGQAS